MLNGICNSWCDCTCNNKSFQNIVLACLATGISDNLIIEWFQYSIPTSNNHFYNSIWEYWPMNTCERPNKASQHPTLVSLDIWYICTSDCCFNPVKILLKTQLCTLVLTYCHTWMNFPPYKLSSSSAQPQFLRHFVSKYSDTFHPLTRFLTWILELSGGNQSFYLRIKGNFDSFFPPRRWKQSRCPSRLPVNNSVRSGWVTVRGVSSPQ